MGKRKYTKMEWMEPEIISMREAGRTVREIAEHFGLEKRQVECWINRYNRKQRKMEQGLVPKKKGRPRKGGQFQQESPEEELKRLRMENELLRDFLRLIERE